MTDARGSRRGAALFDLDGTFLDCNSARLWLRSEWRGGYLGFRDVVWASWWLFRYSLGHAGMENAYRDAVASVAGKPEAEYRERTRAWFAAEVASRPRPGALEALRRHREAGDRVVLATSSTQYAARCAMEAWGFEEAICTVFEVADGRFTGRILEFAYGDAKAERAAEWASGRGIDLSDVSFYTDSFTDVRLLERVGRPVAVNPDRRLAARARERGWEIADWGTSEGELRGA